MKSSQIVRLGLYLTAAANAHISGARRITSASISESSGFNATVVRRDLAEQLGREGKRGVGYQPLTLYNLLREKLHPELLQLSRETIKHANQAGDLRMACWLLSENEDEPRSKGRA
jgi:NADH/NAD ratio-sensing transcriptional regulator Rex